MLRLPRLPAFLAMALALALTFQQAHASGGAPAEDRGAPILLTVDAGGHEVTLTHDQLAALPATEFTTTTIWTEGPQTFRGVRMTTLLEHLGIRSGALHLTAANDYTITLPAADFRPDGAMLAYERNGQPMTLRSKGPLWLVYPFDSSSYFQTEVIYSNAIWQLVRISTDG